MRPAGVARGSRPTSRFKRSNLVGTTGAMTHENSLEKLTSKDSHNMVVLLNNTHDDSMAIQDDYQKSEEENYTTE